MNETVNQRVVRCRRSCNLNQTTVAEKLGMKCSTYSQMERKGRITVDRLIKLAEIFGVSTEFLLSGEEENEKNDVVTTPAPFIKNVDKVGSENDFEPLRQTPKLPNISDSLTLSSKEQTLIKMLRNLSQKNRKKSMDFIHGLYQDEKYNKNK